MKQQGFAIIAIVIAIAAFGGLWTFYHFKVNALETEILAKQAVINTMAKEKAECEASKVALTTANKNFVSQVEACKISVASIQKERNDKAVEAAAAKKAADSASLEFKKRIADILNAGLKSGEDWCGKWAGMITDYTTMRQAK